MKLSRSRHLTAAGLATVGGFIVILGSVSSWGLWNTFGIMGALIGTSIPEGVGTLILGLALTLGLLAVANLTLGTHLAEVDGGRWLGPGPGFYAVAVGAIVAAAGAILARHSASRS